MLQTQTHQAAQVAAPSESITESLSPRELEILELLGRALSTKSVARALVVSPGTVKWHLQNIYGKLRAHSRESAVMRARSIGLIQ